MNNARFLRELDFARVDFYERSDLYRTIVSKKGSIVQGAATIRYRRFIKLFTRFEITTKIIHWDEQSIFMEHQFVGKSDAFVHAIVICRQRLIDCSAEEVMDILLKKNSSQQSQESICGKMENGELSKVKPELPDEVSRLWNLPSSNPLKSLFKLFFRWRNGSSQMRYRALNWGKVVKES